MQFTFLERIKVEQMVALAIELGFKDEERYWLSKLNKLIS